MSVLIDSYPLPDKGTVDFHIAVSFDIQISAAEAQRKVNRWLLNEVSQLLAPRPHAHVDDW